MKFKFIVCFIAILAMVGANSCSKEQDIDSKKGENVSLNDISCTYWICVDGGNGAREGFRYFFQGGDRLYLSDLMYYPKKTYRKGGYKALVTCTAFGKESYFPSKIYGEWSLDKWIYLDDGVSDFMYTIDNGKLDLFRHDAVDYHMIGTVQISGNYMLFSYKNVEYEGFGSSAKMIFETPVITAKFRKDDGKM